MNNYKKKPGEKFKTDKQISLLQITTNKKGDKRKSNKNDAAVKG